MKRKLPWLLIALFTLYAASTLRPRQDKGEFRVQSFASLPVVLNGRVQPLDSVARNALLMIRGNTTVPLEGNGANGAWGDLLELQKQGALPLTERKSYQFNRHPKKLRPPEWLLEVVTNPELADQRFIFAIDHPDLKSELKIDGRGLERSGLAYFSYTQLSGQRRKIFTDASVASEKESQERSTYERAVYRLWNTMSVYEKLKNSFQPEHSHNFAQDLTEFATNVKALRASAGESGSTETLDKDLVARVTETFRGFHAMAALAYPFAVPPPSGTHDRDLWTTMGASLTNSVAAHAESFHPAVTYYAAMMTAYGHGKAADFNAAVSEYRRWLADNQFQDELTKGSRELFFNNFAPFKTSIVIYIVAFLLAAFSLFNASPGLRHGAVGLISLALIVHTSGLIFRMVLEGRPPVTNLYSSAIFIGWGTVVLGLIIEQFWKNGLGSAVASFVGVITLIIAHNLSLDGDTMEMLQAVLDTNFWLATHVVVITLGYSAMFLAGFLAIVYVILGVFTPMLRNAVTPGQVGAATVVGAAVGGPTVAAALAAAGAIAKRQGTSLGQALSKMVYGIVCFATLFSFVGTVLGGIWADQSWGRFWGWDPKENGALLIVLWCAVILHARWGGLVRERGLMSLTIFGNIITAFSWFGVNMLGVGLHSYGFMDAAFKWLMIFNASQLLFMALAGVPLHLWKSGPVPQPPAGGSQPGSRSPVTVPRPKVA